MSVFQMSMMRDTGSSGLESVIWNSMAQDMEVPMMKAAIHSLRGAGSSLQRSPMIGTRLKTASGISMVRCTQPCERDDAANPG
ncbi:hypothetical protein FIBSPDRAFT_590920 [Athelia psychrophila]|uniref:Uncharacterized protein n=1 Tax=Athelia psychrophila TaxID=1759441 RepID=A0A166HA76_9AGAM|nr:hypothetical protein FIBSPDRAFT_590920 [Fibularhizoctonia sp. CBS 109695]